MIVDRNEEEIRSALAADRRRADRDSTLLVLKVLGLAALIYVGALQVPFNFIAASIGPGLELHNWKFDADIGDEEAAGIVVGLAAFVITINVAVFAARLGAPQDVRSELDLIRWQKSMEWLAPLATSVAMAVAATRIPTAVGLFVALMLVAAVALGASDVRIAGRLSALQLEETTARHLVAYAQEQKEKLGHALPIGVKTGQSLKDVSLSTAQGHLYLMVCAITACDAIIYTLLTADEPLLAALANPMQVIVAILLNWIALLFVIGWVLVLIVYSFTWQLEKAAKADVEPGESSHRRLWPVVLRCTATIGATAAVMLLTPSQPILAGSSIIIVCVVQMAIVQVSLRTGRGPGLIAVYLAMAKATREVEASSKIAESAKAAHQTEAKRHFILAATPEERPQSRSLAQGLRELLKPNGKSSRT